MSTSVRKPKRGKSKNTSEARSAEWETSQAEIRIAYTPAGRETIDAITAEMLGSSETEEPAPDIEVSEEPSGADVLAAVAQEERRGVRAPQPTLPYSDRISNAPGTPTPSSAPAAPKRKSTRPARNARAESAPEISVRHAPAGRETLAAIEQELLGNAVVETPPPPPQSTRLPIPRAAVPEPEQPVETAAPLEIFEMVTFVVRGQDAARLSTDALRRRFAEEHLMKRLPITSGDEIDRVDVTPWTVRDTFVVRVWCRLAK